MKKFFLMFVMVLSLFATNSYAQLQEVRGIETRRVIYDGPEYEEFVTKYTYTEYYGYEFRNLNSVSVSVDIVVYERETIGDKRDKIIYKKTIVLEPKETYVFKKELPCNKVHDPCSWQEYYIDYKAYKLL